MPSQKAFGFFRGIKDIAQIIGMHSFCFHTVTTSCKMRLPIAGFKPLFSTKSTLTSNKPLNSCSNPMNSNSVISRSSNSTRRSKSLRFFYSLRTKEPNTPSERTP